MVSSFVNYDAPYRYAEQAVRHAYRTEAQDIVQVSAFISSMMGSKGEMKRPFNPNRPRGPHERHAQAAMILSFVARHLTVEQNLVIRAKLTQPSNPMLERRKSQDMKLVYEHFVRYKWDIPFRYVEDVLRGWSGYGRHHDEEWWAKHLKKSISTLYYWRRGQSKRGTPGFMTAIEVAYEEGIGRLIDPMFEAGLTSE
jgi:hypothetical protein